MNTQTEQARLSAVVAVNVRAEAARRGWTQMDMAERLGMGRTNLSDRYRGRTPWTLDETQKVADIFGVEVGDEHGPRWRGFCDGVRGHRNMVSCGRIPKVRRGFGPATPGHEARGLLGIMAALEVTGGRAPGWGWRAATAGRLTRPWAWSEINGGEDTPAHVSGLCEKGWHDECPQAPILVVVAGCCSCPCHQSIGPEAGR